jgi:hypothetical protein
MDTRNIKQSVNFNSDVITECLNNKKIKKLIEKLKKPRPTQEERRAAEKAEREMMARVQANYDREQAKEDAAWDSKPSLTAYKALYNKY